MTVSEFFLHRFVSANTYAMVFSSAVAGEAMARSISSFRKIVLGNS